MLPELKQITRLNDGKNKDFKSTSKCLVTERLHVCGGSRRKHGAAIRITALKDNRIISY